MGAPAAASSSDAARPISRIARTPVYVISLQRATGRRAAFERRFVNSDLPWSFVDAATAAVPGMLYEEAEAIVAKGRPLHPNEIGCYASHFAIWSRMIEMNIPQAIVLEDDVIVDWKMMERLAGLDFAGLGIDYLRLFGKAPCPFEVRWHRFIGDSHALVEMRGLAFGTQGYVVTQAGAARLVAACRKVRRPVDDEMDRSWAHGLPNLALFPFPIIEETAASSIGNARYEIFTVPRELQLRRLIASLTEKLLRAAQRLTRHGYARLSPEPPKPH